MRRHAALLGLVGLVAGSLPSIARADQECPSTYPGGTQLRFASGAWNYPNGNNLRVANGALFYPDGTIMRYANGIFQRPDGTILREASGRFQGDAFPSDRNMTINLKKGGTLHVQVGNSPAEDRISLTMPIKNRDFVRIELKGTAAPTCVAFTKEPEEEDENSRDFTIHTDAANLDVHVKAGYDPKTVRKALRKALEALE